MHNTDQLINYIAQAVQSIQSRADYQNIQFKDTVDNTELSASEVIEQLLQCKQNVLLSKASEQSIPKSTIEHTLKVLAMVIQSNTAMTKMGQLDTNRTITPSVAFEENKILEQLRDCMNEL